MCFKELYGDSLWWQRRDRLSAVNYSKDSYMISGLKGHSQGHALRGSGQLT